jgi:hypothetical protein
MLTTHLRIVPGLKMHGAVPPFPQYVFMAWCLVKHRDNLTCSFTFPNKFMYKFIYPDDDDDDRDGHRNVGILRTPNAADSPRRLYQVHSPRKH